MKIGIDMDEVIADLLSEYINYLNVEHNMGLTRDKFNGYYTWDTWNGTIEEKIKLFDDFYKSEHFKNVKPIKEAIEVIANLKDNHDLYIITSRPDHLEVETRRWLTQYFPETFSGVYFASHILNKKKSDICKDLEVTLMIEDSLDYALNCATNDIDAILIKYPWNEKECEHPRIKRVDSWSGVSAIVAS